MYYEYIHKVNIGIIHKIFNTKLPFMSMGLVHVKLKPKNDIHTYDMAPKTMP